MADVWSAILDMIQAPQTEANLNFLKSWNAAEGNVSGHSGLGINNPFNTTNTAPGSFAVNSAGVQSFPSLDVGEQINAKTIAPPAGWKDYYARIRKALQSGQPQTFVGDPEFRHEFDIWGTGQSFLDRLRPGSGGTSSVQMPVAGMPQGNSDSTAVNNQAPGPALKSTTTAATSQGDVQCTDWVIAGQTLAGTRFFCEMGKWVTDSANWAKLGLSLLAVALIIGGSIIYVKGELVNVL